MLKKESWTLAEKSRWVNSKCRIKAIRPTKEQIEILFNLFYEINRSGLILCTNEARQITVTRSGEERLLATAGVL